MMTTKELETEARAKGAALAHADWPRIASPDAVFEQAHASYTADDDTVISPSVYAIFFAHGWLDEVERLLERRVARGFRRGRIS